MILALAMVLTGCSIGLFKPQPSPGGEDAAGRLAAALANGSIDGLPLVDHDRDVRIAAIYEGSIGANRWPMKNAPSSAIENGFTAQLMNRVTPMPRQ